MPEQLTRVLAELPSTEPNPVRAERTRARCRARLERQALRRSRPRASATRAGTLQLWQPLIALLGVIYLTTVVVQAIRVYGLFLD